MVGLVEQDRLSLRGDWGLLARMRAALRICNNTYYALYDHEGSCSVSNLS